MSAISLSTYPGCGKAFVLGGNQKNCRDFCAATHAGVIEYDGLPGSTQSACHGSCLQCTDRSIVFATHEELLCHLGMEHLTGKD